MKKLYTFKVAFAFRRGYWRRLEIRGDQTLGDLDGAIREAFGHDTFDHLSEFFPRGTWREGFGEIYPGGGGSGARVKIDELGLSEGGELRYIYDFGDEVRHILTLETIRGASDDVKYPRVVSRSRPRYRYCEVCEGEGRKTVATWVCVECPEERRGVFLCDECCEKEGHDEHNAEEINY